MGRKRSPGELAKWNRRKVEKPERHSGTVCLSTIYRVFPLNLPAAGIINRDLKVFFLLQKKISCRKERSCSMEYLGKINFSRSSSHCYYVSIRFWVRKAFDSRLEGKIVRNKEKIYCSSCSTVEKSDNCKNVNASFCRKIVVNILLCKR